MSFSKSWSDKDHKIILAYLSFFAGVGFGIAGLAVPPIGLIHSSVLILIAQCLVLCATLLGLSVKFDLHRQIFNTQQPGDDKKRKGQEDEINTETEQE